MYKPESIFENKTHEILLNFKIQTDYLILTRRQNLVLIHKNKIICRVGDFIPADHRLK